MILTATPLLEMELKRRRTIRKMVHDAKIDSKRPCKFATVEEGILNYGIFANHLSGIFKQNLHLLSNDELKIQVGKARSLAVQRAKKHKRGERCHLSI